MAQIFDIAIVAPMRLNPVIHSLRTDMQELLNWTCSMHLAGNDEMLPNLADYYYLEIFKTSRYVAFVITADQVAHYQEKFYDHLYNLLTSSLKYRPTVFLDEAGVLNNFEEFRSFVVDIRGRGHVQIMESLQQRFSNARTNEHLSEQKKEELFNRFGRAVKNLYSDRPMVFVFGPGEPPNNAEPTIQAYWAARERICASLEKGEIVAVKGEDLDEFADGSMIQKLNTASKEKLFANEVVLIIALCVSPGAIAEVTMIAQHEEFAKKSIIALLDEHSNGFVGNGVLKDAENFGARVVTFSQEEVSNGSLDNTIEHYVIERLEMEFARKQRHFGEKSEVPRNGDRD